MSDPIQRIKLHIGSDTIEIDPDSFLTLEESENDEEVEYYLKRKSKLYFRNKFRVIIVEQEGIIDLPFKYGDKVKVKIT